MRSSFDTLISALHRFGLAILLGGTLFVFAPESALPFETSKIIFFRIFLGILLFLWGIKVIRKRSFSLPYFGKAITFCMAWIAIAQVMSFALSHDFEQSFSGSFFRHQGLVTMFLYGALFCYVASTNSKQTWRFFEGWIGFLFAALSVINIWFFFIINHAEVRAAAFVGNPVYLGQLIILFFPVALSAFFKAKGQMKILWMFALATSGITLFLTGNRGSLISLLLALFMYGICLALKIHKKIFLYFITAAAVVGVSALIILNVFYHDAALKNPLAQKFIFASYESVQPIQTRFEIWKGAVQLIKNNPVFGVGQDMFEQAFKPFASGGLTKYPLEYADRAHNIILDISATYGIFGLIGYALFFIFIGIKGVRFFVQTRSSEEALTSLGFMTGFLALFFAAQFNFPVLVHHVFFWTLLAFFLVYLGKKGHSVNG